MKAEADAKLFGDYKLHACNDLGCSEGLCRLRPLPGQVRLPPSTQG